MESLLKILTSPEAGLMGLFLTAFLAATFIPVSSEILFTAFLLLNPDYYLHTLAVATAGNSLGGIVMFYTGKLGAAIKPLNIDVKYRDALMKYGPALLAASWMPVIGDPLCIIAGWMHLPQVQSFAWIAAGKFLRYFILMMIVYNWVPLK